MYNTSQPQETLHQAIISVDERFIAEALDKQHIAASRITKQILTVAAMILIIFGILHLAPAKQIPLVSNSPFIITASASNGLLNNNYVHSSVYAYSPGYKPRPLFGDKDIFNIYIRPHDWNTAGEEIWMYYDIIFSYNDVVSTDRTHGRDPHISTFDISGDPNTSSISQFAISGWFDDPTDLKVTLVEEETRIIVQEQTFHIEYNPITHSYTITVTDLYIRDSEGE